MEGLDWVKGIKNVPLEKRYAQFSEENIFDYIFKNVGTTNKFLVDFGAGGLGCSMSNSRYLLENEWKGLRMDGDPMGDESIKKEFITAENICSLLAKYLVPKSFDFLSIDTDGNDLWILKNLLDGGYSPRLIVNEFNGSIVPGISCSIANNPSHTWQNNDYYGASFEAFKTVLIPRGYTLVYQIATNNMFFIRQDLVPQFDYGITYHAQQYHAHSLTGNWVTVVTEPIIDKETNH